MFKSLMLALTLIAAPPESKIPDPFFTPVKPPPKKAGELRNEQPKRPQAVLVYQAPDPKGCFRIPKLVSVTGDIKAPNVELRIIVLPFKR
jgi:hypothetical protein